MVTVVVSMNLHSRNQSCSQQGYSWNLISVCSSVIKVKEIKMRNELQWPRRSWKWTHIQTWSCAQMNRPYRHKSGKKPSFSLTLAEALLVCFPPEPSKFCSRLNNLLFSTSSILFSSNNNLTYTRQCFIKLLPGKLASFKKIASISLLTSSSALVRLILRCSLSCWSVFALAASDNTFRVEGLKLPPSGSKVKKK